MILLPRHSIVFTESIQKEHLHSNVEWGSIPQEPPTDNKPLSYNAGTTYSRKTLEYLSVVAAIIEMLFEEASVHDERGDKNHTILKLFV